MPKKKELLVKPRVFMVASGKGGTGGTTTSTLAVDFLELGGEQVEVVQVDNQDRLSRILGRDIASVRSDVLRESRRDPSAGLHAFRPLMDTVEKAAQSDTRVVVDIGGALAVYLLAFAALSDLDEDLREMGMPCTILVPALTEPESISQAARTLMRFREVLPSATTVLVENQRDGAFADLVTRSEAHNLYVNALLPAAEGSKIVTLPAVAGRSWALFERHFCRPLDVVRMSVADVMRLTELPRSEAKIARGDVAAWLSAIEHELLPILGLGVPA